MEHLINRLQYLSGMTFSEIIKYINTSISNETNKNEAIEVIVKKLNAGLFDNKFPELPENVTSLEVENVKGIISNNKNIESNKNFYNNMLGQYSKPISDDQKKLLNEYLLNELNKLKEYNLKYSEYLTNTINQLTEVANLNIEISKK